MLFVKLKDETVDKFPYYEHELINDFPDTSFPTNLTNADLSHVGVFRVVESEKPSVDYSKNLINDVKYENDQWIQNWVIVDASTDEITSRTNNQASLQRLFRNKKLNECDWTQLADVSLSTEQKQNWNTYRQTLRDVPNQAGFPWDIQWPEIPA